MAERCHTITSVYVVADSISLGHNVPAAPRPGGPMTDRITIFDTTLRDGEQAPGFSLKVNEKLQLARQLDMLGVDVIEAGFPIASEADAEAVRAVAAEVRRPV